MEWEVCPTLLRMTCCGSQTPYQLDHMLPFICEPGHKAAPLYINLFDWYHMWRHLLGISGNFRPNLWANTRIELMIKKSGVRFPLLVIRRRVWRTSHSMLPLFTQELRVAGGTKNLNSNDWLQLRKMLWILLRGSETVKRVCSIPGV